MTSASESNSFPVCLITNQTTVEPAQIENFAFQAFARPFFTRSLLSGQKKSGKKTRMSRKFSCCFTRIYPGPSVHVHMRRHI